MFPNRQTESKFTYPKPHKLLCKHKQLQLNNFVVGLPLSKSLPNFLKKVIMKTEHFFYMPKRQLRFSSCC